MLDDNYINNSLEGSKIISNICNKRGMYNFEQRNQYKSNVKNKR